MNGADRELLMQMVTFALVVGTAIAAIAVIFQAHCEVGRARKEHERVKLLDFKSLTVTVIRHELRKAGYYELKNKKECSPHCKNVLGGIRILCICFVASDDDFNVKAYQIKCLEGNGVFDDEMITDEDIKNGVQQR